MHPPAAAAGRKKGGEQKNPTVNLVPKKIDKTLKSQNCKSGKLPTKKRTIALVHQKNKTQQYQNFDLRVPQVDKGKNVHKSKHSTITKRITLYIYIDIPKESIGCSAFI